VVKLQGFGYDYVGDDYKVIQHVTFFALNDHDLDDLSVSWEDTSLDLVWEIYSLRSNSWKKLDVDIPKCYHEMEGSQVYMDVLCR